MSACFGACSLVGVLLAAPIPPRFLQAPAERRALAEQPVYVHLPDCVWNHREALFGSTPTSLEPTEREKEREMGAMLKHSAPIRLSVSPFPEEISLTVPGSWQAEAEGVEGQGRGVHA